MSSTAPRRTPTRTSRRLAATAAAVALVLPLAACGDDADGSGDTGGAGDGAGDTTITVLAAASLTETFTTLAEQFEADHEGVEVELAFDSSATLAGQAVEGAPADVLATADSRTMDTAADVLAADPQVFATNTLVMAVPAGNPADLSGFEDVADGDATYVVCVDTAPCGAIWAAIASEEGVTSQPASLEVDVKAVLAKVTGDEADAGFVYETDAVAAGDQVETFEVPGAEDQVTDYPIAPLDQAGDPELAQEFVDLVLSEAGQQVLADAGFGQP
ncbi:molybdate ABC transporter substrate-binding protein [Nocardioides sp. P86]|uniref:molybdate ABC transporter substrate-binding protein n=1 Tax=Nocardioides sp. P86 TaxID=2939569 RepID=UPI00203D9953|nr:molybdate ABC transporter substrate-binding protein [Nocardioides sp. P86]MCM3514404.1 molybdate ABC transporter substrate-binding protein [Nocardioides sp. P86]